MNPFLVRSGGYDMMGGYCAPQPQQWAGIQAWGGGAPPAQCPPSSRYAELCAQLAEASRIEQARGNDVIYGIDSGAAVPIGPAVIATLTVAPQLRHVPQRLSLTDAIAGTFVITDMRTGVQPIMATVGAMSASLFTPASTVCPFRSVVLEVGMDFSVTVQNATGSPARFTATVIGKALPSWTPEAAYAFLNGMGGNNRAVA